MFSACVLLFGGFFFFNPNITVDKTILDKLSTEIQFRMLGTHCNQRIESDFN